ncbi:hypothetical protein Nepgr_000033 [Nepenthes gracilis]|uniref:Protein FLX-like 1 n=1 Tax=Nepenthes gracilis TaxID=150966 RepID=A0AAD3P5H7_NEPGR|nr:hypothetical protein Nepgr_000033 [Nepenthes gracilis]
MAGRNYPPLPPPHVIKLREEPLQRAHPPAILIEDPRLIRRGPPQPSARPHPAIIEERIAAQQREIQTLLVDNQRLAATHVALKEELSLSQQELRRLAAAAQEVKCGRDDEVREVYERSLKMEADVRAIDALKADLSVVREDVQKLRAIEQELTAQLKEIEGESARAEAKLQEMPAIKAEIELIRHEIQKGRAAIEFEKKTHAGNLEQGRAMEKNMISMSYEIEKLRAELANAEKRAKAAAAAANPSLGYAESFGNPRMGYGGVSYPVQYAVHQVQVGTNPTAPYGHGSQGPFDIQPAHAQS